MFEDICDELDRVKWEEDATKLLKRAADLLHEYCAEINGDMNCYLGTEIESFLNKN